MNCRFVNYYTVADSHSYISPATLECLVDLFFVTQHLRVFVRVLGGPRNEHLYLPVKHGF